MLARRIPGGKEPVPVDALAGLLPGILEEDQALLLSSPANAACPVRARSPRWRRPSR